MSSKEKSKKGIGYYITLVIMIIILVLAYKYYQTRNFNDFIRSEANIYTSIFSRDSKITYGENRSYKIQSNEFNDAMFYKTIKVNKNQSYKVTAMVKTNNVQAEGEKSGVGAQISIEGTTERSVAISGTQDWQKIELIFNSKNREEINIGFRLGGYLGDVKGEAWFSDFAILEGMSEEKDDNKWKFACFVFETTDVVIDGKQVNISMTQNDINDITNTISLFEKASKELSRGKMTATCDTIKVNTPLSNLSYSEEFGYYISPEDVEEQIKETIASNDYDHIFIIVRLGNEEYADVIEINDWIGLRFYGLLWNRFF